VERSAWNGGKQQCKQNMDAHRFQAWCDEWMDVVEFEQVLPGLGIIFSFFSLTLESKETLSFLVGP
jgi:hypothetical protein